ncbi:MAG: endonuclease domain-containing protein [Propionibacteriaceae bacterium]
MGPLHHELELALTRGGGVVTRKQRPDLATVLKRRATDGRLTAVLPGVYVASALLADPGVLALAATRWRGDAVVVGAAAARLTFWPELSVPLVEVAVPARVKLQPTRYRIVQRRIPVDLVRRVGVISVTAPALTALDLCPTLEGDGIDRVLLRRAATLDGLHAALTSTSRRRGNGDRRRLLLESRDEPWSGAERVAHKVLHDGGLEGWRTNVPVTFGPRTFFVDIAFVDLRIAIEIDGRSFHGETSAAFENDRWRQNMLVLAGWTVLRFTWRMLQDHPADVLAAIRLAVGQATQKAAS